MWFTQYDGRLGKLGTAVKIATTRVPDRKQIVQGMFVIMIEHVHIHEILIKVSNGKTSLKLPLRTVSEIEIKIIVFLTVSRLAKQNVNGKMYLLMSLYDHQPIDEDAKLAVAQLMILFRRITQIHT